MKSITEISMMGARAFAKSPTPGNIPWLLEYFDTSALGGDSSSTAFHRLLQDGHTYQPKRTRVQQNAWFTENDEWVTGDFWQRAFTTRLSGTVRVTDEAIGESAEACFRLCTNSRAALYVDGGLLDEIVAEGASEHSRVHGDCQESCSAMAAGDHSVEVFYSKTEGSNFPYLGFSLLWKAPWTDYSLAYVTSIADGPPLQSRGQSPIAVRDGTMVAFRYSGTAETCASLVGETRCLTEADHFELHNVAHNRFSLRQGGAEKEFNFFPSKVYSLMVATDDFTMLYNQDVSCPTSAQNTYITGFYRNEHGSSFSRFKCCAPQPAYQQVRSVFGEESGEVHFVDQDKCAGAVPGRNPACPAFQACPGCDTGLIKEN